MSNRRSKVNNLKEIRSQLAQDRSSLSPPRFSEGEFEDFLEKNDTVIFETNVTSTILPIMIGNTTIPSKQNILFTNLEPIVDGLTTKAKPDLYDGTRPEDIDKSVRDELGTIILPSKRSLVPALPNFLMEVKAPMGSVAVGTRQVCYDGAIGARAMHSLQNYRRDEPIYDGNAYTISCIYQDGHLKIYAHHPKEPTMPGERPGYYMTQVNAYAMTNDRDTCAEGLKAFRNAREWTKKQRDKFIKAANERARRGAEMPSA